MFHKCSDPSYASRYSNGLAWTFLFHRVESLVTLNMSKQEKIVGKHQIVSGRSR